MCHHENGTKLTDFLSDYLSKNDSTKQPELCLVIGPEGGWSDNELDLFRDYASTPERQLQKVIWGERVFRTETAALALASACLALFDWN